MFITILLLSCKPSVNPYYNEILGSWRMSEIIIFDKDNPEIDEMMRIMMGQELKSKGLVLHFFPDSTYTELTEYSTTTGNWEFLSDNTIRFGEFELTIKNFETINSKKFLIASIVNEEDELNGEFRFSQDGKMLENFKKDPFYGENNKWRNRPLRKETNEEIRERLLNYILHYAYILNASVERDQSAVSFAHSMGLIQQFRGGIGRIPKNKINEDWINCFYDEEDAMKAFYLFSSYLNKGVYKGGSTGSWVKDNYEILLTLFYEIKKKSKEDEEQFIPSSPK